MTQKVLGDYVLFDNKKLGAGQFGKVFLGEHQSSKVEVAIKVVEKNGQNDQRNRLLEREIQAMTTLLTRLDGKTDNLVRSHSVLNEPERVYLVMEYCEGGNLETFLYFKRTVAEVTAREIVTQLVRGYETLRQHGFVHRDIKPLNILRKGTTWKLADFGFSKLMPDEETTASLVGSPLYMAPEILVKAIRCEEEGLYTYKCDIWSLGVVLYRMLYGKTPYTAYSKELLYEKISREPLAFDAEIEVSEDAKNLIKGMLTVNPDKRMDLEEVKRHTWFRSAFADGSSEWGLSLPSSVGDNEKEDATNDTLAMTESKSYADVEEMKSALTQAPPTMTFTPYSEENADNLRTQPKEDKEIKRLNNFFALEKYKLNYLYDIVVDTFPLKAKALLKLENDDSELSLRVTYVFLQFGANRAETFLDRVKAETPSPLPFVSEATWSSIVKTKQYAEIVGEIENVGKRFSKSARRYGRIINEKQDSLGVKFEWFAYEMTSQNIKIECNKLTKILRANLTDCLEQTHLKTLTDEDLVWIDHVTSALTLPLSYSFRADENQDYAFNYEEFLKDRETVRNRDERIASLRIKLGLET
eukprot:TRINITY_DN11769_c0_g1_i4.p1 TRINITY_DN11769_c0_g1~~TRINITY_DN11769_c0_g1_i4.p1  ORF type:complete len:584 (-),score=80.71 TRINITY_DN11769_c0_g1_i4:366-2117(-)